MPDSDLQEGPSTNIQESGPSAQVTGFDSEGSRFAGEGSVAIAEERQAGSDEPNYNTLLPGEIYWKDRYEWLLTQGYRLRKRYHPKWIASWKGTGKNPLLFEDSEISVSDVINHATMQNNQVVVLKRTDPTKHPEEIAITRLLSEEYMRADPDNHSVPLIEVLDPPTGEQTKILVLPLLRYYDDPKFETIGEAIQFIDEFLAGVSFLHRHNINHGDISLNNIMMDARSMYPEGFHPVQQDMNADWSGPVSHSFTRTEKPPKYYLIDFGLSRQYKPGEPRHIQQLGTDLSVPEYSEDLPIDSFAIDVYCVGNMLRQEFLDGDDKRFNRKGYYGFDFLRPLVTDMMAEHPSNRPTISEAREKFRDIVKGLSELTLRSPCIPVPESGRRAIDVPAVLSAVSIRHWWIQIRYMLRSLPAIPKRRVEPEIPVKPPLEAPSEPHTEQDYLPESLARDAEQMARFRDLPPPEELRHDRPDLSAMGDAADPAGDVSTGLAYHDHPPAPDAAPPAYSESDPANPDQSSSVVKPLTKAPPADSSPSDEDRP